MFDAVLLLRHSLDPAVYAVTTYALRGAGAESFGYDT